MPLLRAGALAEHVGEACRPERCPPSPSCVAVAISRDYLHHGDCCLPTLCALAGPSKWTTMSMTWPWCAWATCPQTSRRSTSSSKPTWVLRAERGSRPGRGRLPRSAAFLLVLLPPLRLLSDSLTRGVCIHLLQPSVAPGDDSPAVL